MGGRSRRATARARYRRAVPGGQAGGAARQRRSAPGASAACPSGAGASARAGTLADYPLTQTRDIVPAVQRSRRRSLHGISRTGREFAARCVTVEEMRQASIAVMQLVSTRPIVGTEK